MLFVHFCIRFDSTLSSKDPNTKYDTFCSYKLQPGQKVPSPPKTEWLISATVRPCRQFFPGVHCENDFEACGVVVTISLRRAFVWPNSLSRSHHYFESVGRPTTVLAKQEFSPLIEGGSRVICDSSQVKWRRKFVCFYQRHLLPQRWIAKSWQWQRTISKDSGWSSNIKISRSGGASFLVRTTIFKTLLPPLSSGKQSAPKNSKFPYGDFERSCNWAQKDKWKKKKREQVVRRRMAMLPTRVNIFIVNRNK